MSIFRNPAQRLALLSLLLIGLSAPVHGAVVVVPNELASSEGNASSTFPFSLGLFLSQRYQQVYAAGQFTALSGPEIITQIAFRPDASAAPFAATLQSVQITLSTTDAEPDAFDPVFDNNLGNDATIVFDGSLTMSSGVSGPVGGPMDFDVVIDLTTPFLFDPGQGNLLLEIDVVEGTSPLNGDFDAVDSGDDGVSRAYCTALFSGCSGDTEADLADSWGLVTRFVSMAPSLTVPVDIKFCDSPNAFNCKKNGVLPVTLFGTDALAVADIDPDSLRLCLAADPEICTGAPRDYAEAEFGRPDDIGAEMCAVEEVADGVFEEQDFLNPDSFMDLDVTFEASEVRTVLGPFCDDEKGASSLPLVVKGETWGGTAFMSQAVPHIGVDQLLKANK